MLSSFFLSLVPSASFSLSSCFLIVVIPEGELLVQLHELAFSFLLSPSPPLSLSLSLSPSLSVPPTDWSNGAISAEECAAPLQLDQILCRPVSARAASPGHWSPPPAAPALIGASCHRPRSRPRPRPAPTGRRAVPPAAYGVCLSWPPESQQAASRPEAALGDTSPLRDAAVCAVADVRSLQGRSLRDYGHLWWREVGGVL